MPSTQEKRIPFQRACSDPYSAGGEPPGEPPAPRLEIDTARPGLSEEQIEEAVARARVRDAIGKLSEPERRALAETMVALVLAGEVLRKFGGSFSPGDVILVNDPYAGMGHMPDVVPDA